MGEEKVEDEERDSTVRGSERTTKRPLMFVGGSGLLLGTQAGIVNI